MLSIVAGLSPVVCPGEPPTPVQTVPESTTFHATWAKSSTTFFSCVHECTDRTQLELERLFHVGYDLAVGPEHAAGPPPPLVARARQLFQDKDALLGHRQETHVFCKTREIYEAPPRPPPAKAARGRPAAAAAADAADSDSDDDTTATTAQPAALSANEPGVSSPGMLVAGLMFY